MLQVIPQPRNVGFTSSCSWSEPHVCTKHQFFSCSRNQLNFCVVPAGWGQINLSHFCVMPHRCALAPMTLQHAKFRGAGCPVVFPHPYMGPCCLHVSPGPTQLSGSCLGHHQEADSRSPPLRTRLSTPPTSEEL